MWTIDELHQFINEQHKINGNVNRYVSEEELESALTKIYRTGKSNLGPEDSPMYAWKSRKERGLARSNFDVEPEGKNAPPPIALKDISMDSVTLSSKSVAFDGEHIDYKTYLAYMKHFFDSSGKDIDPTKGMSPQKKREDAVEKEKEKQRLENRKKRWKKQFSVAEEDSPVVKDKGMSEDDKLFWNTTFTKKGSYGKFGSEPRSKALRGISSKERNDSGYLACEYARNGWHYRDMSLNAVNPRPQIVSGFGVLAANPGPGEYSTVSSGFEHSSRFKRGGISTVKGRSKPEEGPMPSKTPLHLLTFKTPEEDSASRIKRRIRVKRLEKLAREAADEPTATNAEDQGALDSTAIVLDPFTAKIKRISDDQVRSMLDDLSAVPGPNAYKDALKPFLEDKMNVGYARGPTSAKMYKASRAPRSLLDFSKPSEGGASRWDVPGPGTYDVSGRLDSPTTRIDPVPRLQGATSPTSRVGPGSYDVIPGLAMTSPLHKNRVALSMQRADYGKTG